MTRLPLLPTVVVGAACATMIGLGVWQLQRATWKSGLIAQFESAKGLPVMAYPATPTPPDLPLFRRAAGHCAAVSGWRTVNGRNRSGASGWVHIAQCGNGAEGPGMAVETGWSNSPAIPQWSGGAVEGVITTDASSVIRLVSDRALAHGLEASAVPDPQDMPNNHLGYAIQWFAFAAIAALIYGIALFRRKPAV